ncbi:MULTISPECIES: amino acid ABC transporter substrate-binding protein [Bifidobacterium]|jgi:cystine transport system substrate-binding protein|uniref:amino acid ABC transporter substrate-binding protein n=1 Tax=Bifidobacterium TaxID=1678 RepID=UPI00156A15D8|nr:MULTISPECIES: amino acid ABC transporter substrate-binding protein [Bifidobacterium]MEE0905793.1 amino acid ABC transporter substrate-binding protein [Bifidobacterium adolescentis]MEE0972192.1 amino acid ABC transporter substrate-binding protein [Bifidobacterium ruminantium]
MAHTHFALKKIAAVAVVAAAIVGFSACGSSNGSAASSELDQIKKNGAIVFGTEGTYAPFSYHDSDNKLTGYDVEVATAVAKELGVKAKFVESNWDSLLAGVDSKKFDSVADQVTPNGERKQKYDFSDLYTYSQGVAVTKKGNTDIKTFADIKGKNAAETKTSNWNQTAQEHGANIVSVNDFAQAVDAITAGRADVTLNDKLAVLDYLKQKPNAGVQISAKSEVSPAAAFPIRKGEDSLVKALNEALAKLQKDGTLKKLSIKYFGEDVSVK